MPRGDVAAELVAYGRELEDAGAAQVGSSFSCNPDADALIARDPNAFLIGVLFTQGIPAERAWSGPWLLKERLGTLEVAYLATHPKEVRAAVQQPPMLHRFKETLPRWIGSAAGRLVERYGGSAASVWPPGSHVLEVVERLSAFDGIGRKKAVMAAEILARHFGVELQGRECGQVAYDVQVRRVFLRSGLVEQDSLQAIESAAAEFCPESPATLDLPAWLVGRETCRPKTPRCDECRLGAVCARRTWLTPVGVGARDAAHSDSRATSERSTRRT
jgi:endonuclease-3